MSKIKVAFIGFNKNSHARPVYYSVKNLSHIYEIAGFVLPENEREKFPDILSVLNGLRELTLQEIMEDETIEAVIIDTEEIYLTKYALIAARHGKAIHMEKPGGRELSDFEELIKTVKEKKLPFHIAYMYRYNPAVQRLLKQAKSGELGEIISVEAQMNCIHPDDVREWLNVFPGGMMFFLGCHLIDLVMQFKGLPDNVIPLNRRTGVNGIESEDFGMAVLEYKNGVSFAKTSAMEYGGFARRQLVVTGSKKTVELKPLEMYNSNPAGSELYTGITEYSSELWTDAGESSRSEAFDRYEAMMIAFSKMVAGEIENPYTYDYELDLFKTILKACGEND